jgi:hypothetical protein
VNELFVKLKRLFEPRPRPAESAREATADRPPPPAPEPPRPVAPPPRAEAPPVEAPPSRAPASFDVDDLAEVRAALDAVAETPVTTDEPAEEAPVAPQTGESDDATVAVPAQVAPAPIPGRVGDALVLTLGTPPTTFTVAKTSATLGRGQENSIRLDDLSVSRHHARIAYRQGGYWISDLGSMGGTWVNGMRLSAPRRIASGEVIDIGLCRLMVSFTGGAAKSPSKKNASKPR